MTMMNIRKKKAKWKEKCWLRRSGPISSFESSVCIASVHCFWVAGINSGDLILLQPSAWLTCFTVWLIHSERLPKTSWESKEAQEPLDILLIHHLCRTEEKPEDWQRLVPTLSSYFAAAQPYTQKVVLTFPAIALTSPLFSVNAPLPPVIHSSSGTLTFPAELLNQHFLHPNSQFGFMTKKNTGKLSFLIYKCIVNEAGEIWGWADFWVTLRVLCLIYWKFVQEKYSRSWLFWDHSCRMEWGFYKGSLQGVSKDMALARLRWRRDARMVRVAAGHWSYLAA